MLKLSLKDSDGREYTDKWKEKLRTKLMRMPKNAISLSWSKILISTL